MTVRPEPYTTFRIAGRTHLVYHNATPEPVPNSHIVRVKQARRDLSHRAYAMGYAASCSCGHERVLETHAAAVEYGCGHLARDHSRR